MFLRVASAATVLLIGTVLGTVLGLAIDLGLPGGAALAQYYPPPPGTYQAPYPGQPYPGQARQLPPPVQADQDDDLDALGPPRTYGYPVGRPPQGTQYGGRGVYPPEADVYAPPPPGYGNPNGYPPGPPDGPRPPMSIGPNQGVATLPPDYQPETGPAQMPPQFRRTLVDYRTKEPAGTIVIDTPHTYLYLVLGNGKAMRYGIGVGREGFTWSGTERVSRVAEWPDWHPPAEMIDRQPYLPRFMAGGESNPLGARALYLGKTEYRIHGTNQPSTIGTFVSSGCIRLTNDDVTDLYGRVQVGTRVVVLPGTPPDTAQATQATSIGSSAGRPAIEQAPLAPPVVRTR
ncbi:MAG TPA: L,D-transpeptidase [Xanthobacteraceae bacterium]